MRGKLVVLGSVLVAFILGGGVMYYYTEVNDNSKNYATTTTQSTGVIKCSNEVTVDETGISTAVGEIYDATVTIQNYKNNKYIEHIIKVIIQ